MSLLIRTDRIWDHSQPIYHDGPALAEYKPPNLTHNYRRQASGGWGGPEKGEPAHIALLGAAKILIEELNIPTSSPAAAASSPPSRAAPRLRRGMGARRRLGDRGDRPVSISAWGVEPRHAG